MKLFSELKRNVDSFGLIAQNPDAGADGGDTMNREGYLFLLLRAFGLKTDPTRGDIPIELSIASVSSQLVDDFGNGRRHPDPEKWYSEWNRMSRDQYIAFLIGLLVNGENKIALKMMCHHFFGTFKMGSIRIPRLGLFTTNTKRNFVYKNLEDHLARSTPDVKHNYSDKLPDITGPEFCALYIRGFFKYISTSALLLTALGLALKIPILIYISIIPLVILFLGDLETLVGSINKAYFYNGNDDGNHIAVLAFHKIMRTRSPIIKLARYIYFNKRDYNKALDEYFAPQHNHAPFGKIFKQAIKEKRI